MGPLNDSSKSLINIDESSSSTKDSMDDCPIDLPEDVFKEGQELKKQIEEEENQKVAQALEEHASEEQADHDMRYKRLMHLLDRSKFYANFLLQRMAAKKEEAKIKQEKQAKREANKAEKVKEKENETDFKEPETPSKSVKTRGAKRHVESSPTEASESKRRKGRGRKNVAMSDASILNVIDEEELQKRATKEDAEEEAEPEAKAEKLPDLLENVTLRPYQMEGFKWLVALYENGMNGILADEMGLGKTVQCISLIAHLVSKGVVGPFLICAPLSTLPNWMAELKRFTPRIPTLLYHGNQEKRDEMLLQLAQKYRIPGMEGIKFFPVVVSSFEVVIRDRKVLERFQWRYIIVDEGHRLKNFQCRLVQELKKYPSSNRLLLTGTPLQNNLTELWSLLNFLLPEIFDDLYVFQAWFRVEEFQGDDAERKIVELERKEHVLSMLHQILSPFLLRRVKADVDLQIPPKKELLVYCPLSPFQQELYRATVNKTIEDLLGFRKEEKAPIEYQENGRMKRRAKKVINYAAMGDDAEALSDEAMAKEKPEDVDRELERWIQLSDDFESRSTTVKDKVKKTMGLCIKMNNPMMQLKKIVNHPYLVRWDVDPETGDYVVNEDLIRDSGKLTVLDQMMTRLIKDGHRTLIFSQMTMMLDILADYCDLKGYKFARLDGSMSLEDRGEHMRAFNTDPDMHVFLISTRAGGLGINLTSADTVIIYDSDWNPQADLQAQDRCHRIGQTKPVVVYRLVAADTIDQRVIDRAGAKRKLEKLVIQKGKFKKGLNTDDAVHGTGMSVNELVELLKARDYNGEHRSLLGQVFTDEEMNALMDRSDLTATEIRAAVAVGAAAPAKEKAHLEGVFKRIDPSD